MKGTMRIYILASIFILVFSFPAGAENQTKPRLITVTGDAEVMVTPDEVILKLGIQIWDEDLSTAKNKNDEKIQNALALAKKYGINPKHVQTDYVSIEPWYKKRNEHNEITGYLVRKTIVFTLKDISKFEDILSSAIEVGVTHVHGIQFRTTELRKYRDQARALAIEAAQEKANDMAKELGQKVGKPYTIQENRSGWWHWYNSWWGSRWSGGMSQNIIQNMGGEPMEPESSIALGQISVNARVTVSFELE